MEKAKEYCETDNKQNWTHQQLMVPNEMKYIRFLLERKEEMPNLSLLMVGSTKEFSLLAKLVGKYSIWHTLDFTCNEKKHFFKTSSQIFMSRRKMFWEFSQ